MEIFFIGIVAIFLIGFVNGIISIVRFLSRLSSTPQDSKDTSQKQAASIDTPVLATTTKPTSVVTTESFWESWYKENSINFLLYLGAFFIVLSSIIFLSFTWETLSGMTRVLRFSLFTVCFGIAGACLYR